MIPLPIRYPNYITIDAHKTLK